MVFELLLVVQEQSMSEEMAAARADEKVGSLK